ncbi:MAG: hypothetical protein HYY10_03480, partial [Candidatus Liptonbacteria bacterium]|nr:hypothetical protein [Candidatus Liptonbacteria bacterium]
MRTKGKIFSGKFGLILTAGLATFVVVGLFLAQGANAGEQISDSSGLPIFYADRTIANLTINTVKITSPKNPVEPGKKFRLEGIIRPDLTANTRAKAACAWPEWGPEIKRHNSGWLGCDTIYKDTVGENSSEFSIELEAPDKPGIYRIDLYVQRTMPVYFAVVQMIDGHVSIEVGGGSTPNKSPAMPSCSVSPASNFTGEEFTIKAKSADPDGDKIKYNFSFDNAETFDAPFSGYVGSNTELSVAKRWDVAGVKSIKIKAIDERGGESGWTSCSAEVKDPPPKNNPPATPSCEVSPAEGPTTTSFSIKAKSTDPDGDTLKYEFAFDGNFSLPVTKPSSGYVQSGAEQSTTKQWTTEGAKQIQIRAIDLKGAASGWASCSASVKNPVDETGDRTVTPPPPPPPWVGGWDGWIKMSGKTDGGESYGVRYDPDTTRFCGYAWGGNVVGWVKFGPLP